MIVSKKLIKIGGSLGILIDKSVLRRLGIKEGDWIQADIETINRRTSLKPTSGLDDGGNLCLP